jgi:Cys-rich repeat protein
MSAWVRFAFRCGVPFAVVAGLAIAACGDVTSDVITRGADASDACEGPADCPSSGHCDVEASRCVECLENSHCAAGEVCASPAGTCVQGCSSTSCPSASPVCDATTKLCRGCTQDTECASATPHCDPAGRCVECVDYTHCTLDPERNRCDTAGRCVECTDNTHCEADEECSPDHRCDIRCVNDDDCQIGQIEYCDGNGFCVECRNDEDCDPDEVCRRSECVDRVPGS